ncbi:MAG: hypothetical protein AVDCRST_MAG48-3748 [uncultured Friedmanniella sp.]|uniref:Uncharacterized protein n=1 Tax=uncultured Friedmanniella sp. TaxID=335381 RepID=A0A6J4M053_9ACTN|nr:MAG: hypothetical protein AVDCRST_MAG48-3748 [uncultured Friedmanniella sp.]
MRSRSAAARTVGTLPSSWSSSPSDGDRDPLVGSSGDAGRS